MPSPAFAWGDDPPGRSGHPTGQRYAGPAGHDRTGPARSAYGPPSADWAILIKHIYQADPLRCPKCGGTMKIIAFIEAHQPDLIRKILEHCGLWHDPPPRAPPRSSPPSRSAEGGSSPESDSAPGITHEVDPDFLEHVHREALDQPLTHDAALPLLVAAATVACQWPARTALGTLNQSDTLSISALPRPGSGGLLRACCPWMVPGLPGVPG